MAKIILNEEGTSNIRKLYPKSDGWYQEDNAGNITKLQGASVIGDLSDVDTTDILDGQVLMYDDNFGKFFPGDAGNWEQFAEGIRPKHNKEIAVGHPDAGREAVFGEGDSYNDEIIVKTFDGANYYDRTSRIQTLGDGQTLGFESTSSNNIIYLSSNKTSSDYLKHWGVKVNITTALVIGSGSIVYEYYNGSSWVAFNHMVSDSSAPFKSYGNNMLDITGSYQFRYDTKINNDWSKVSVDGDLRFWSRMRIVNSISSSLQIDYLKLHTSRTEINGSGFVEYFGMARPIKPVRMNFGSWQAAAYSPANQDIYLSDGLGVGRVENQFEQALDRTGYSFIMPLDLDTSCGIKARFHWYGESSSNGNIKFTVRWSHSKSGDGVYSTTSSTPTTSSNERSITATIPFSSSEKEKLKTMDVYLEVPEVIAEISKTEGADLWLTFERNGNDGADTYNGNVVMANVELFYMAWRDGGNAENF